MKRMNSSFWFLVLAPVSLSILGCQPGGVGDPCIPEDEYQNSFSGYSVTEVNVESRSFQCETRVCLVNHFQGRVSCPYGQDQAAADSAGTATSWGNNCRIPATDGSRPEDRIIVPVDKQKVDRRTSEAVYCSCRCANVEGKTNDGASYCACPSGYQCAQLIPNLQLGELQLAGSYCIKSGTAFKVTDKAGVTCDSFSQSCGTAQPN
jgi:hypothetical protein